MLYGLLSSGGALALAALALFGAPLRASLPGSLRAGLATAVAGLRGLHSGHVGDYVAWWTAGASALGAVCLLALG